MVVRWLLLFLLCLTGTAAVSAAPFYDSWVYPGETFTTNNTLFAVDAGSSEYQVLLHRGDEQYLISYGECAPSQDGYQKYCYLDSDYVACQRGTYDCPAKDGEPSDWCCMLDVAHVKYDAGRAKYGVRLEFSDVVPTVSVSHAADKTLLKLGESAAITVTFQNTGTDAITGVTYVEHIPEGFTLNLVDPLFKRSGQELSLSLNIGPGETKSLIYELAPKEYLSGTFTGNLTYSYKGLVRRGNANVFTISVPSPFLITHKVDPTSGGPGSTATYSYVLKNNDGQNEMAAQVRFGGLADIIAVAPEGVTKQGALYLFDDALAHGTTKTLTFQLKPQYTGTYMIGANATMDIGGEQFAYRVQDTLSITAPALVPDIRVKTTLLAGTSTTLRVFLSNPGETTYHRVSGSLDIPGALGASQSFSFPGIAPHDTPQIAEATLAAPAVGNTTRYTIVLRGTYATASDETFTFTKSVEVTVQAVVSPYVITLKPNATAGKPGDEIVVNVKVKNVQGTYRTLTVADVLPAGALVTAGVRQIEMSLKEGEEREAYTYHVKIPDSYAVPVFLISTEVFDKELGALFTKEANITVKVPLVAAANATNVTAPAPQTNVTTAPVEKKPGFFRRTMDAIIGFFQSIF